MNQLGQEAASSLVTSFSHLVWLDDDPTASVWSRWQVTYRDVFILGPRNQFVRVYNLTQHDLALVDNRAELRQWLMQAARAVDTDNDGLPDDWEWERLGSLAAEATGDEDHDGHSNAEEFALGSDPNAASSMPRFLVTPQADGSCVVSLSRPSGAFLDFTFETSNDLVHWRTVGEEFTPRGGLRVQFDGLGRARAEWRWMPAAGTGSTFLRLRVVRREPR